MAIERKELRDYIRLRQAREMNQPLAPAGNPALAGGPVTGRRITGPQLVAAQPIIEKIGDDLFRQRVQSYFQIFPVINVLEMITDPGRDEFAKDQDLMNELATVIIGPEYKAEKEKQEPQY